MHRAFMLIAAFSILFCATARGAVAVSFLNESIWYTPDPFFAGERVRIYALVVNRDNEDAKGVIAFVVNENEIGREPFSFSAGTNNQVVWHDVVAPGGAISIRASIAEAYTFDANGNHVNLPIKEISATLTPFFVDIDTDHDRIGNATDLDDDNDGLTDIDEQARGSDPLRADSDNDGVSDQEDRAPRDPAIGRAPDTDGDKTPDDIDSDDDNDGVFDFEETATGTNPLVYDTDHDGRSDGEERTAKTNPMKADTDGDGRIDGEEHSAGTNPLDADTDDDGRTDGQEYKEGTNPKEADTDDDGLSDGEEKAIGTNPIKADSDNDGQSDGVEHGRPPVPSSSPSTGGSAGNREASSAPAEQIKTILEPDESPTTTVTGSTTKTNIPSAAVTTTTDEPREPGATNDERDAPETTIEKNKSTNGQSSSAIPITIATALITFAATTGFFVWRGRPQPLPPKPLPTKKKKT